MVPTKQCADCNQIKPVSEYYKQRGHSLNVMSYCRLCFNQRCVIRWKLRKIKAIQLLGSKCNRCGLQLGESHYSVFEFHHRDSKQKDFAWNKLRLKTWSKILHELKKCDLLCANCHRIVHAETLGFPEQSTSHHTLLHDGS
jgi:hypothetical protein